MNNVRYVIQFQNGSYLKENWKGRYGEFNPVNNLIDTTLYTNKGTAVKVIKEMLEGAANLSFIFDIDNPPVKIIEVEFDNTIINSWRVGEDF